MMIVQGLIFLAIGLMAVQAMPVEVTTNSVEFTTEQRVLGSEDAHLDITEVPTRAPNVEAVPVPLIHESPSEIHVTTEIPEEIVTEQTSDVESTTAEDVQTTTLSMILKDSTATTDDVASSEMTTTAVTADSVKDDVKIIETTTKKLEVPYDPILIDYNMSEEDEKALKDLFWTFP